MSTSTQPKSSRFDIDFSIVVRDDELLADELCRAASKGMVSVIRDTDSLDELGFDILTFDVLFFGSVRIDYRFVNVSMRAELTRDHKGIEEKVDSILRAVMSTMATELAVSEDVFDDTFENGSVGISGSFGTKEPAGVWPEGNEWRQQDYRWDATDSNEAVARIQAGETREDAIQFVEERKGRERRREATKHQQVSEENAEEPESFKQRFWSRWLTS